MGIKMLQGWACDQSNQTDNCVKHLNRSFSKELLISMSQKLIKLYINRMINIKITYTIHVYLLFSWKTIITRCILNFGICMYNAIMGKKILLKCEKGIKIFPTEKYFYHIFSSIRNCNFSQKRRKNLYTIKNVISYPLLVKM